MVEEKWNTLISISRDFCNMTDHFYSSYILPFTIYAQEILFDGNTNLSLFYIFNLLINYIL